MQPQAKVIQNFGPENGLQEDTVLERFN